MPWQQQVADVGLEVVENDDGLLIPAYREVTFTVPRQSGKTTTILCWEIHRALGWAQIEHRPQVIAYSAQTAQDARKKLLDDQVPMLEPYADMLGIDRVSRSNGNESVRWKNKSFLYLLASSEDSGHGRTVDLGVEDELFADHDMRRDQALSPAQATRPAAQIVNASTAGTGDSYALNRKVETGRASVEQGKTTGVAYFEWSATDDDDPADPATWWRCMPALGRTINLAVVEHAYETMELDEFKRAWLNVPTATSLQVIPANVWDMVNSPDFEAAAEVFAVDANPDRTAAAIVAAGPGPVVEVVDYRARTDWLVPRAIELHQKYGCRFVLDPQGPAGGFVVDLQREGIPLELPKPREVVQACGMFYDRVVNTNISIRRNPALDDAVAGAVKRPVGDAWAWGRKSSRVDISLLMAASLGLWAVEHGQELEPAVMFY